MIPTNPMPLDKLRTDVSVLYADPRGPYLRLVADWWDEQRDAKLYAGPNPVVAHPPCGPWSSLRHLHSKYDEWVLGVVAVEQVQRYGGILEHPAGSKLWDECSLPKPGAPAEPLGFTVEVEQVNWGHVARKRTWLYCSRIDRATVLAGIRTGKEPTHWASGGRKHGRKGSGGFAPPGIKICSAQQRRRTPMDFALWLVELASQVDRATRVGVAGAPSGL